jgi:hypothetical protein
MQLLNADVSICENFLWGLGSLKEKHPKLNIRNAVEGSSSHGLLKVSGHNVKMIIQIRLHAKEELFQHIRIYVTTEANFLVTFQKLKCQEELQKNWPMHALESNV